MTETANLRIKVDSSGVRGGSRELDRLSSSGRRAEGAVAGLSSKFKLLGAAVTALGVGVFINRVISATKEQEAAVAQLRQGIESTAGAAGKSLDELTAKAREFQRVTTFGDEAIIRAQSVLLTFTNVAGEAFDQATEAALNMSARMGTDLNSSILQVGKALNDPIQGVTALTRAGVQFTDSQKDTIASLVETGRVADAQKIVLAELETQFGGSARAARDTFGGALAGLRNAFGDLFEATGGLDEAAASVNQLTETLQDPEVIQAMETLTSATIRLAAGFLSASASGINFIARLKQGAGTLVESFRFAELQDNVRRSTEEIARLQAALQGDQLAPKGRRNLEEQLGIARLRLAKDEAILEVARQQQRVEEEVTAALVAQSNARSAPVQAPPTKEQQAFVDRLVQQEETLTLNNRELIEYRLNLLGVTGDLRIIADAAADAIEQFERMGEQARLDEEAMQMFNDIASRRSSDMASEAERLIASTRTQAERIHAEIARVNELAREGFLDPSEANEVVERLMERLDTLADNDALIRVADQIRSNIGGAIDDLFTSGELSAKNFFNSVLRDIARVAVQLMIIKPLMDSLFGASGSAPGGAIGGLLGKMFGGVPGAATGGSFKVGGAGGTDSKLVSMRLTPGELVEVTPAGQNGGGGKTIVNVIDQRSGNSEPVDVTEQMAGMDRMITVKIRQEVAGMYANGSIDRIQAASGLGVARRGSR